MSRLKQLHAFCTKTGEYPSRLAIQGEIERLMKEEKAEVEPRRICQAQGADCITCDLSDCGDRLYGRRK